MQVGINIAEDTASDILREFLPETAHKLRVPCRAPIARAFHQ
jgi:hypothetical protein